MSRDPLDDLFGHSSVPKPDNNAKKRAINLAMAEFETAQAEAKQKNLNPPQGFINRLRLTLKQTKTRVDTMAFSKKKQFIVGASTACVLVTSAALLYQQPGGPDGIAVKPVAVTTPDEAKPMQPTLRLENDLAEELAEELTVAGAKAKDTSGNQTLADVSRPDADAARALNKKPNELVVASSVSTAQMEREKVNSAKKYDTAASAVFAQTRSMSQPQLSPAGDIAPLDDVIHAQPQEHRDRFSSQEINPIKRVAEEPVSTFSIDVDTASYSYVRRQLNNGYLPQKNAVRVEELVNYFDYDYPVPTNKKEPFKPTVVVTDSPWKAGNKLVHIGIKGYQLAADEKPQTNLVFLLDVSGSMNSADKLPLVKQSMGLLLDSLRPEDTVAIAVYAGAAGTVLEPTAVKDKIKIINALERLSAGGSTAGGEGIKLAYQLAEQHFNKNAVNRIILATDGDFNVGITGDTQLKDFVERKKEKGIYLSVLGFGVGNYQDALMQTLAQNGNGIAAYIDTLSEAQKVLVTEASSSLFPIANDVKIQMEFNPAAVSEYRLIGYETRALKQEDFNNDKVDAGDIGAGHSVTAIYEVTPVGLDSALIEPSRYADTLLEQKYSNEIGYLKLRYKLPGEPQSKLITHAVKMSDRVLPQTENLQGLDAEVTFATAVAGFAQLLKGGKYMGDYNYDHIIALASRAKASDDYGYRTEFIQLVRKAKIAKAM